MNEGAFKAECVKLTNQYRRKHGRKPLKWKDSLARAAEFHAEDMAKRDYFSHDSKDGTSWAKRVQRFLARRDRCIALAENVAYGQDTAAEVVRQWIESPGHRRNILDKSMRYIGVGFARRGSTEYWVQDFGSV